MTIEFAPTGRRPAATKAREAARFARMALAASILLVAAFVLGAAVLVPRLAGGTPYTVLTGSMSPAYPPGTMIVTRPHGAVGLGSVITYQLVSGEPEVVTHRVVAIARNPDGRMRFQTQGDANNSPDLHWVRPEQVQGVLWYAVPGLGRVSALLTGDQRQWGVQVVAVLLLGYAGVMFVSAYRRRRASA